MRRNSLARKTINEGSLNSEELWNAICYVDPDSDSKRGNLSAVLALLLVALLICAVGLALHFRGL